MTATIKGKNIYYSKQGSGAKTIVLVHGYPQNGIVFDKQVAFLQQHFTVLVPDLPGAGQSEYNEALTTIDDFADAVNAVIEKENINECYLFGHSMGGYITLAFAEKYPDKLKGFGLIHSHALADDEEKIEGRKKTIQSLKQYGSEPFVKTMVPGLFTEANQTKLKTEIDTLIDHFKTITKEAVIRFTEIMISRPDRTGVLKNAHVPVLFILGEEDNSAKLDVVLPQTHLADETFIKIFSDVAHMGMIEEPDGVNETILDFVGDD